MTRLILVLAVAACGKPDPRDADCAKVRAIVERTTEGVPRRYRDTALRERGELKRVEYTDDAIRRVATDDGVTVDAIEHACAPAMTDREHDCAAVRTYFAAMGSALLPDRSRTFGIRDESGLRELAQRTYLDGAVKQAVADVVRDSGAAFYSDAPEADATARTAYERLAELCKLR